MKKLVNEIKLLSVEVKITLTILLGILFSMPIQYLRGLYRLDTMFIKQFLIILLILSVIKLFCGVKVPDNKEN